MQSQELFRVQVIFPPEQAARIEALRRRLPDLPTRAETIRRLCEQALADEEARP
jgi:hypothetical protein